MKIGYLAQLSPEVRHPPFDGPANHVRSIAQELEALGHSVSILAGIDGEVWINHNGEHFTNLTLNGHSRPQRPIMERSIRRLQTAMRTPYFNYFESRQFAVRVAQELGDVDILLERTSWMGFGGALAARQCNLPWVLEYNGDPLHDLDSKGMGPDGIQRQISTAIMKRTLSAANHIIASGQGWAENLTGAWQVPAERITIIENGTSLLNILPRDSLRTFQENGSDSLGIVYLGGFFPWHGTLQAVRAFRRLVDSGVEATLVMIGSGTALAETKDLVAALSLEKRVRFTGSLSPEEYAPILADCEIGLSPYCGWKEYSGLKLFDYKAAGLATIASGEGGTPHTLHHGTTGWIIPPCDEEALAEALISLAAHPNARRDIGRAARLEAENSHGWQHTARHILSVFEKVLHEQRSAV